MTPSGPTQADLYVRLIRPDAGSGHGATGTKKGPGFSKGPGKGTPTGQH